MSAPAEHEPRCNGGCVGDSHLLLDTPAPAPVGDVEGLAELIWHTSRADESTISAAGADIVARAVLASDWLAAFAAAQRAEALREAAEALEGGLGGLGVLGIPQTLYDTRIWLRLRANREARP